MYWRYLFIGLVSLMAFMNSFSLVHADSVARKFAETKMIGCEDNDIVMWNRVWAACNYYYNLTASKYYNWMNQNAVDMNGWNYWRLYLHVYATCPSGYKIPSLSDFTGSIRTLNDIFVLQLPAAWIYESYNAGKYNGINLKWTYLVSNYRLEKDRAWQPDRQFYWFNLNDQSFWIVHNNTAEVWDINTSLRCIRIAPSTREERLGKLVVKQDHQETPNYGLSTNENFGISTNQNLATLSGSISSDPYVNEKMKEIHACFEETFSGQLANIDVSISRLTEDAKKWDTNTKKKYEQALKKLIDIRKLFVARYSSLFQK